MLVGAGSFWPRSGYRTSDRNGHYTFAGSATWSNTCCAVTPKLSWVVVGTSWAPSSCKAWYKLGKQHYQWYYISILNWFFNLENSSIHCKVMNIWKIWLKLWAIKMIFLCRKLSHYSFFPTKIWVSKSCVHSSTIKGPISNLVLQFSCKSLLENWSLLCFPQFQFQFQFREPLFNLSGVKMGNISFLSFLSLFSWFLFFSPHRPSFWKDQNPKGKRAP